MQVIEPTLAQATEVLKSQFGMARFREGQSEVIERVLAGKNTAAIFPTGGGKSLCYQLPALLKPNLTVVVSPLMALMKDQVDMLLSRGISAVRLDSSLSADESRDATNMLRDGTARLLYVAPERFFNERFRTLLTGLKISLFAVDEAHCISQWGHNFRPDYLKLARLARSFGAEQVLALTATATPEVANDICREFEIAAADCIRTDFYRPNLQLKFTAVDDTNAFETLLAKIKKRPQGPVLVYVTLQKTAEEIADKLKSAGSNAQAYHAGLPDEKRQEIQDWFMSEPNPIVVATIAFGMGIDKADIRYVYHFNPAKSLENYAQEIGRAGRDAQPSICESLINPTDRVVLENFAYGDTPSAESVELLCNFLAHQPEQFYVSQYSIGREFDIRDLVLRTLLTYLELDEFLEGIGPRYDHYQFKPKVSSGEILKNFQEPRRRLVHDVLAMSVKKKIWYSIDITKAASRIKCERQHVIQVIEELSNRGWLEVEVKGLMHGYRRLKPLGDTKLLGQQYFQRLHEREASEVERIDAFLQLALSRDCQSARLSNHFGQALHKSCGQCTACLGESISSLKSTNVRPLGTSSVSILRGLVQKHPDVLKSARQQARFLCGLASPAFFATRLSREPHFGCCAEIPFRDVLKQLEAKPIR